MQKFVNLAKDKNSNFRLMGFGHRVYRNFDPRAKIIKRYADEVLKVVGVQDPLLDIANNWRRLHYKTNTSLSVNSIQTSTSIAGSSTRRWASRLTCSLSYLRWGECRAGSRTGSKCTTVMPRLGALDRSTQVQHSVRINRSASADSISPGVAQLCGSILPFPHFTRSCATRTRG